MFSIKKDTNEILKDERHYYPLLPLRDVVVFPHVVVPLFVGRDKSIKALEYSMSHDKQIFLSAQKDAKVDDPTARDIYSFGTLGSVLQLLKLPDGTVKALIAFGADKEIKNKEGKKAMDFTSSKRNSACAVILEDSVPVTGEE